MARVDWRLPVEEARLHGRCCLVHNVPDRQRRNATVQLVLSEHVPSVRVEVASVEVPQILFERLIREVPVALLAPLADMLLYRGGVARTLGLLHESAAYHDLGKYLLLLRRTLSGRDLLEG